MTKTIATMILTATLVTFEAAAAVGRYTVPTSSELKPFAEFEVSHLKTAAHDDFIFALSYELPAELTGTPHYVKFEIYEFADGVAKMASKDGDLAHCKKNVCEIKYRPWTVDKTLRDKALREKFPNEVDFSSRRLVAESFSSDPGGVLEIFAP